MQFQGEQSWQTFTFGAWNVRGLSKKKTEVVAEIERENEDIVVLTETKIRGVGREDLGMYVHLFSGITVGTPRAGVSILVKKELSHDLNWEGVSERIIRVELSVCNCKVVVIGVYWVDECRSPDVKNKFQGNLKSVLDSIEDSSELIILGDFNAWVGTEVNSAIIGKFGVEELNNNGTRLKTLCGEFNLKIQNTFFKHRDIHKYTWYGSKSKKSLVDYCITRQASKLKVLDVVACRWLECGTDHVFLEATISFPFLPENPKCPSENMTPKIPKYKTYLLFSKTLRASYKECLESLIDLSVKRTTNEMYQHLQESIHAAAKKVLGFRDEDMFGEFLWDSEIRELRRLRMNQSTQETSPVHTWVCDHTIDPGMKNEIWEGICADVNSKGRNKKYLVFRSILEELLNETSDNAVAIDKSSLENFFKKRFTENRANFIESTNFVQEKFDADKIQLHTINVTDIERALDNLVFCNFPAPGGINIQLLKYSSTKTKVLLSNLIHNIFNGENIPSEINEMYIYVTANVKNRSNWVSECTVQVMHPIMNIMCSLLKGMLENTSFKETSISHESQLAATFILRLILQKNATKQEELVHLVVIDLADSYASVSHEKLFETLHTAEVDSNLIWLIKHLTELNSVRIIRNGELSDAFQQSKGLKTNCSMTSTLYKIYISETLEAWRKEIGPQGIQIGNDNLPFLYSKDKLAILANSKKNLESMLGKLKRHFKRIGIRITPKTVDYLGTGNLKLGKETIPGVLSIDYQGSLLGMDGGNEQDINRRVSEIKKLIGLLHPCARDEGISKRNKRMIFNSIVRGFLTRGCETWTVTEPLRRQIDAVELRYWKWCCESLTEKLTSSNMYELMNVKQTVSNVIMLKKAAWYTKVKEMSDDYWTRRILEWEPEGKRKAARPRAKWVDGVEDFLTTMGHLLSRERLSKRVIENALNDKKKALSTAN